MELAAPSAARPQQLCSSRLGAVDGVSSRRRVTLLFDMVEPEESTGGGHTSDWGRSMDQSGPMAGQLDLGPTGTRGVGSEHRLWTAGYPTVLHFSDAGSTGGYPAVAVFFGDCPAQYTFDGS